MLWFFLLDSEKMCQWILTWVRQHLHRLQSSHQSKVAIWNNSNACMISDLLTKYKSPCHSTSENLLLSCKFSGLSDRSQIFTDWHPQSTCSCAASDAMSPIRLVTKSARKLKNLKCVHVSHISIFFFSLFCIQFSNILQSYIGVLWVTP